MRMVMRIPTEDEEVFLLACTCPEQRQRMMACRHCLRVNEYVDREPLLYEQTHFMYTAAYHSDRLTLSRYAYVHARSMIHSHAAVGRKGGMYVVANSVHRASYRLNTAESVSYTTILLPFHWCRRANDNTWCTCK